MKKLIFIIILFFNLIPVLKKGEIRFSGPETALADSYGEDDEEDWSWLDDIDLGGDGEFEEGDPTDVIPTNNFDSFLDVLGEHGYEVGEPFQTTVTIDGVEHEGTVTSVYQNDELVAGYFNPNSDNDLFNSDNQYAIGNTGPEDSGNYDELYSELSDIYGLDIIDSSHDDNGDLYFVLADGDVFYPNDDGGEYPSSMDNPESSSDPSDPPQESDDNTGGTDAPSSWDDYFNDYYDDYYYGNDTPPITTQPKDPCIKLYGAGSSLQYCGCVGGTAPKVSCPTLCDSTSMAIGTDVKTFFQNDSVKVRINQLTPFGSTPGQNEEVFLIQDYRPDSLGIIAKHIEPLGPSGGISSGITQFTRAKVHTHPKGKIPAPSVTDFKSIMDDWNNYKFFSDSYVLAADSSKFALHVSDTTKLKTFRDSNTNFVDTLTNDFVFNSSLWKKRKDILDSFTGNNGSSYEEAFARALAVILEEAGITLLKAEKGSNEFKKLGIAKRLNPDGTEMKDKQGRNKYVEADCQ